MNPNPVPPFPERIRLVAVDLDGTLLDSRYRVSPANRAAVRDLLDDGIHVVPVTGRRFSMGVPYAEQLGLDGLMVFQNGAVIKELGGRHLVWHQALPFRLAREVVRLGRASGFSPILFCEPDGGGTVLIEDGIAQHCRLDRYLTEGWNDVRLLSRFEGLRRDDILQVLFTGGVGEIRRLEGAVARRFGDDVKLLVTEYAQRDLSLLDVMSPGVSKGDALERVGRMLGVGPPETAAFGDNFNDVDMLDHAALPLLMANAPAELRERYRRHLPSCDRSGVAWGIWRHVLRRPDRLREWFPPA
ncbi:MAG: HAD-IIB family hydrolase [Acidobacteria bacterium]|nr:HAD-IIB family hydrolase [Acidobacteriota bacterium]